MIVYKLLGKDTTNSDTGLHTAECTHVRKNNILLQMQVKGQ